MCLELLSPTPHTHLHGLSECVFPLSSVCACVCQSVSQSVSSPSRKGKRRDSTSTQTDGHPTHHCPTERERERGGVCLSVCLVFPRTHTCTLHWIDRRMDGMRLMRHRWRRADEQNLTCTPNTHTAMDGWMDGMCLRFPSADVRILSVSCLSVCRLIGEAGSRGERRGR